MRRWRSPRPRMVLDSSFVILHFSVRVASVSLRKDRLVGAACVKIFTREKRSGCAFRAALLHEIKSADFSARLAFFSRLASCVPRCFNCHFLEKCALLCSTHPKSAGAAPRPASRGARREARVRQGTAEASRGGLILGGAFGGSTEGGLGKHGEWCIPRFGARRRLARNLELGAFARVIGLVSRGGRTAERARRRCRTAA